MRTFVFAALLLALSSGEACAQSLRGDSSAAPASQRFTAGVEVDALPYLLRGYYGSVWLGRNRWRVRGVVAQTTLPEFLVEQGYEHARIDVSTVLLDHFFANGFRGFWIGAGAELWKTRVEYRANGIGATWGNAIVTVGGGYVWKIKGNLYLNPWLAGHLLAGGKTAISVGDAEYNPRRFMPEASLKIGWHL